MEYEYDYGWSLPPSEDRFFSAWHNMRMRLCSQSLRIINRKRFSNGETKMIVGC